MSEKFDYEQVDVSTAEEIAAILTKYSSYRVVTDAGASMLSGWGTIVKVYIHHGLRVLELVAD